MKPFQHSSLTLPRSQSYERARRQKENDKPIETTTELSQSFRELTRSLVAWTLGHESEAMEHASQALRLGETPDRLEQLAGWVHSELFSREEKAAFSLVESLLAVHSERELEIVLNAASRRLEHSQLLELIFATFAAAEWDRSWSRSRRVPQRARS